MRLRLRGLAAPVGALCSVHRRHSPRNQTTEDHHVVPVAWQLFTSVPTPPFPGKDPNGRGALWDDRTVTICPTGHRNVHFWIVTLMHAAVAIQSSDPVAVEKAVSRGRMPVEFGVAVSALSRYVTETGASLLALAAVGEWGQS